jgi:parvulin-like peptidyl-prolyl isomerase
MLRHAGWWLLLALTTAAQAQTATDGLVISRGGASITLQDIDTYIARVPKEQRERFIDSPTRIRELLNNLLLTKQLAVQGRAEHLEQQPGVESQLRAAQDEVFARARMSEFLAAIKVPNLDKLVAEQYATHKELYVVPASVDVKHVLIATAERADADAKVLADKVRVEALADPKGFDQLVEKYSDDVSKAQNHGLMKDATAEKYVEPFRKAVAALTKVGEISPVIATSYGYHVVELVALNPQRQQTFDEVRAKLTAATREQYIANVRRDFVNELTNSQTDINSATMDTLRDRYDADGNVRVAGAPANGGSTSPASPKPDPTHR